MVPIHAVPGNHDTSSSSGGYPCKELSRLSGAPHWHGQVERANNVLFTTTACCTPMRGNFEDTKEKGYSLFHLAPDSAKPNSSLWNSPQPQ